MENYKTQTLPLSDLYKTDGILDEVGGVGTIEEVFGRIVAIMDPLAASKV